MNVQAQKKPPESPCPRGAKDTDSSGSDWTVLYVAAVCLPSRRTPVFFRSGPPASLQTGVRSVVRRKNVVADFPDADPPTWFVAR